MPCLDTDILVALLRNDKAAVDAVTALEKENEPLSTTTITAYELLKGASISKRSKENRELVKKLLLNLRILELDMDVCEVASDLYARLKKGGDMIGEFDILTASICTANNEPLLSRDKHLKKVKGLKVSLW